MYKKRLEQNPICALKGGQDIVLDDLLSLLQLTKNNIKNSDNNNHASVREIAGELDICPFV